jgi:hypothetical protein
LKRRYESISSREIGVSKSWNSSKPLHGSSSVRRGLEMETGEEQVDSLSEVAVMQSRREDFNISNS